MDNKAINEAVSRHIFGESAIPGYATLDYCGEIEWAWQVVDRLMNPDSKLRRAMGIRRDDWISISVYCHDHHDYGCEILAHWSNSDGQDTRELACECGQGKGPLIPTAPMAICVAALAAVGHPVEEAR